MLYLHKHICVHMYVHTHMHARTHMHAHTLILEILGFPWLLSLEHYVLIWILIVLANVLFSFALMGHWRVTSLQSSQPAKRFRIWASWSWVWGETSHVPPVLLSREQLSAMMLGMYSQLYMVLGEVMLTLSLSQVKSIQGKTEIKKQKQINYLWWK